MRVPYYNVDPPESVTAEDQLAEQAAAALVLTPPDGVSLGNKIDTAQAEPEAHAARLPPEKVEPPPAYSPTTEAGTDVTGATERGGIPSGSVRASATGGEVCDHCGGSGYGSTPSTTKATTNEEARAGCVPEMRGPGDGGDGGAPPPDAVLAYARVAG